MLQALLNRCENRIHVRAKVECATFYRCSQFIMEINPLLNSLKDLSERTNVLRGYL